MQPLYDMMRDAQNGAALRVYARHFGLDENQVADAFAALMPAFSAGLKRNVAGPRPMADFLAALSQGHHRRYFEDMQAAFSPEAEREGNAILGHLFGSPELSRRVAKQAADATGLAEATLKRMLPVMAATIMGGLYSQATAETGARSPASDRASGNLVGDILREMIRYQAKGRDDLPERKPGAEHPFSQMMEAMFGSAAGGSNPFAGNPMADMFRQMSESRRGDREPESEPLPEPEEEPLGSVRTAAGGDPADLFGPMLEAGREIQTGYQNSMERLFDEFLSEASGKQKSAR